MPKIPDLNAITAANLASADVFAVVDISADETKKVLFSEMQLAFAGSIADNAVTYAKIQDVTASKRLLGRNTAGAGDPEEVTLLQALDWIETITPTILSADTNDWNPTGLSTANLIRVASNDHARGLTGIAAQAANRLLVLANVGNYALVLRAENAGSSAVNRFAFPNDVALHPLRSIVLRYDGTFSRWTAVAAGPENEVPVAGSTSGSVVTFYVSTGRKQTFTLNGNYSVAFGASWDGAVWTVELRQDATGGRTVTGWPGGTKWAGGVTPTLSSAPNAIDRFCFIQVAGGYHGFVVGQGIA